MNWNEIVDTRTAYRHQFGTDCVPFEYVLGNEPSYEAIALVAKYCMETGKPYEQIDIKSLETWMQEKGYPIASPYWHWREVSNEQREDSSNPDHQ